MTPPAFGFKGGSSASVALIVAATSGNGSSSSRHVRRAGKSVSASACRRRCTRPRVLASPATSRGVTRPAASRPLRRSRSPTARNSVSNPCRHVGPSRKDSTASRRSPMRAASVSGASSQSRRSRPPIGVMVSSRTHSREPRRSPRMVDSSSRLRRVARSRRRKSPPPCSAGRRR